MAEPLILKVDYDIAAAEAKQKKLDREFDTQRQKVEQVKTELQNINSNLEEEYKKHKKINEEIAKQQARVEQVAKSGSGYQLDAEKEKLSALTAEREHIYAAEEKITALAEKKQTALSGEESKQKSIADQIKLQQQKLGLLNQKKQEAVDKANKEAEAQENTAKETERTSNSFEKFTKRIGKLAQRVFVFSMITKAMRSLRSAIGEKIAADPAMAKMLAQIQGNLAVIGQIFYNTIRPALEWALTTLNKITQVFAYFLQQMTGVSAKAAAQQLAAQQTAAAAKKTAKSTKETAKNTEKATAGFDTIQKIETKTADVSSTDESSGIQPDYSQFTGAAAMTEQEIIKLEGIIGGALMAVGLLMIAFGQIPVGIGLLVVGALMTYKAIEAVYGTADEETKRMITSIMTVAGGAMIALGLLLIVCNQLPIGIACLAVGVALIVAASILSGESVIELIKQSLTGILLLVAPFAAAIGLVLIATGANLALGLACLVMGVAMMVAGVVMSYNTMSDELRQTIGTWMSIIGAALIVIGVILICTGAGIPLGLGLLMAGAMSLFGGLAMKLDINVMLNKIKELAKNIGNVFKNLWNGIKSGFKAMVNGIIKFANLWIDGLNLLLTPVRGLVYGIAKAFGSDISWSQVRLPHIPALATGAVIPGGSPFLAELGDQPAGKTNIEAPEDLIRKIVREESGGNKFTVTATGSMAQLIRLLRLEIKKEDERASIYAGG